MALPGPNEDQVARLFDLIDSNPARAISEARSLSSDLASPKSSVKAAILVDGGARARDRDAVAKGVELFRSLSQSLPERVDLRYNLADGLVALTDLDATPVPDWYAATAEMRQEARKLYTSAGRARASPALATQALTNLGNALDKAHRWAEAYDAYAEALRIDPANGMASGCAAQLVWRCVRLGLGDRGRLTALAQEYGRHAQNHDDEVRRYGGAHASETFRRLPVGDASGRTPDSPRGLDAYRAFAVEQRLVLVPFVEATDMSERRWDALSVTHFTESVDTAFEPPALFAMFNTMKEDFLLARHLAHVALKEGLPDPGVYVDTLDYANYGTRTAVLRLAQRLAVDVLDKIAGAVNEILGMGLSPQTVHFTNLWRQKDGSFRPAIAEEMRRGNQPLIALSEMREDLMKGVTWRRNAHCATAPRIASPFYMTCSSASTVRRRLWSTTPRVPSGRN